MLLNPREKDGGIHLCEVEIRTNADATTGLCDQHRVNVESDILEAVRRASFSHMETNIELLSLLVELPWLSSEFFDFNTMRGYEKIVNELFDRAALYLLEDALVDECDREGEDDLLDDLEINEEPATGDEDGSTYNKQVTKKMRDV